MIQYHKKFYFCNQFLESAYPISARCYAFSLGISQHNDFIRTEQAGKSQIQKIMLKFGHWLLPINIPFYITTDLYAPGSLIPLCAVPHKHLIYTSIVDHLRGIKVFSHLVRCQCSLMTIDGRQLAWLLTKKKTTPDSTIKVCIRVIGPPELSKYAFNFLSKPTPSLKFLVLFVKKL